MYFFVWRDVEREDRVYIESCADEKLGNTLKSITNKMNVLFGNNDEEQAWPRIIFPFGGVRNCLRQGEIMVFKGQLPEVDLLTGFAK